jgi:hypothetical protein
LKHKGNNTSCRVQDSALLQARDTLASQERTTGFSLASILIQIAHTNRAYESRLEIK